ncbi:hypothetical protein AAY473_012797 [Plecturocebus cupreus]
MSLCPSRDLETIILNKLTQEQKIKQGMFSVIDGISLRHRGPCTMATSWLTVASNSKAEAAWESEAGESLEHRRRRLHKLRLYHCIPAWVTEQNSASKKDSAWTFHNHYPTGTQPPRDRPARILKSLTLPLRLEYTEPDRKIKRQATDWKEMFAKHTFNKALLSKIYNKDLSKFNRIKKKTIKLEHRQKCAGACLVFQHFGRSVRQENCLNPEGSACSEQKLSHFTPAWLLLGSNVPFIFCCLVRHPLTEHTVRDSGLDGSGLLLLAMGGSSLPWIPIFLTLGQDFKRLRLVDCFELRSYKPAWATWQNPISTKNTKVHYWLWWCTSVVPATSEAEAVKLLEPGKCA